ncbi:ribosomal-protein-alanine N-acetyltransferase [Pseudovibrio denitrificans]|uniref:Ribosomal-protein-alanine N-acetyltransferase n=1 Tax=Pseudovibrio denitrificans TaxID=258256 RepID=A0A1I7CCD8_9HYPH|nr:GNAT family N-acetyltransferase [Pseudovibrio denitrificans]SFT97089.1 ribosomal-protein-alanine N-acetyltransferase [Pseudovibrio denitrificans]
MLETPIQTPRCILAKPTPADKPDLIKLFSNEKTREFLGGKQSEAAIEARCSSVVAATEVYHAVVYAGDTSNFLGLLTLGPYHDREYHEISYEFLPEHWGQGYAEESLKAFLPIAMENLKLMTILAETQLQNTRSIHLLQKLGMKKIRQLKRFGEQQAVYALARSTLPIKRHEHS